MKTKELNKDLIQLTLCGFPNEKEERDFNFQRIQIKVDDQLYIKKNSAGDFILGQ